jgi:hypothetical protein
MIDFIQKKTNKVRLKQTGKLFLINIDDISTIGALLQFLQKIDRFIKEKISGMIELVN